MCGRSSAASCRRVCLISLEGLHCLAPLGVALREKETKCNRTMPRKSKHEQRRSFLRWNIVIMSESTRGNRVEFAGVHWPCFTETSYRKLSQLNLRHR